MSGYPENEENELLIPIYKSTKTNKSYAELRRNDEEFSKFLLETFEDKESCDCCVRVNEEWIHPISKLHKTRRECFLHLKDSIDMSYNMGCKRTWSNFYVNPYEDIVVPYYDIVEGELISKDPRNNLPNSTYSGSLTILKEYCYGHDTTLLGLRYAKDDGLENAFISEVGGYQTIDFNEGVDENLEGGCGGNCDESEKVRERRVFRSKCGLVLWIPAALVCYVLACMGFWFMLVLITEDCVYMPRHIPHDIYTLTANNTNYNCSDVSDSWIYVLFGHVVVALTLGFSFALFYNFYKRIHD